MFPFCHDLMGIMPVLTSWVERKRICLNLEEKMKGECLIWTFPFFVFCCFYLVISQPVPIHGWFQCGICHQAMFSLIKAGGFFRPGVFPLKGMSCVCCWPGRFFLWSADSVTG